MSKAYTEKRRSLSIGSWWSNPDGRLMSIDRFLVEPSSPSERLRRCHVVGCNRPLLFLTDDEIRRDWVPHRPPMDRGVFAPSWMNVGSEVDYAHDCNSKRRRPAVLRIQTQRFGWIFASGISPIALDAKGKEVWAVDARGEFQWDLQLYDSFIWRIREAIRLLTPGWGGRASLWDRLLVGDQL